MSAVLPLQIFRPLHTPRDLTSNLSPTRHRESHHSCLSSLLNDTSSSFVRATTGWPLFSSCNISFRRSGHAHIVFSLRDDATQVPASENLEPKLESEDTKALEDKGNGALQQDPLPSGDMEYEAVEGWNKFVMRFKMLTALPWQRIKKGSVLKMKISGQITEQLQGRFSQGLSLPQLCQNLIKAAYDPRVSVVLLQIEPLAIGWGKIEEIRRHICFYRKSGKLVIGYMPVGGEKEFYLASACEELYVPPGAYISLVGLKVGASFVGGVLRKAGVEPKIQRIGKYKSVGDTLSRNSMSEENREMLTALLDDIYDNWTEQIAASKGKQKKDVEGLLEEGIFEVEKLKKDGWITDIKYFDEIDELLKQRLEVKEDKEISYIDYKKYTKVKQWTLNLSGGKEQIAVLRAVGGISRTPGGLSLSSEGIVSDQFIKKIREARESKNFKAVILRIDSPGGDALASDLMWRELRLLASEKPLIASMVDVAASGGYYMAMGAGVIVSENLTLTGSIGVVTGVFKLGELYEKVGFTKEVISRGRFAELDAEQRPFRPDEEEFFAKSAQDAYRRFRDKAAFSRSMEVDKMEALAQGRVWTGKAAKKHGLVDAVGGFSTAMAIAKQKAGISQETKVSLVELSKRSASFTDVLERGLTVFSLLYDMGSVETAMNVILKKKLFGEAFNSEVQARMDNIFFQNMAWYDLYKGSNDYILLILQLLKSAMEKALSVNPDEEHHKILKFGLTSVIEQLVKSHG